MYSRNSVTVPGTEPCTKLTVGIIDGNSTWAKIGHLGLLRV